MLAEAKREADRILGEAREQAVREASQTEIAKLAERQAQEIVEEARRQARRRASRWRTGRTRSSPRSRSTWTSSSARSARSASATFPLPPPLPDPSKAVAGVASSQASATTDEQSGYQGHSQTRPRALSPASGLASATFATSGGVTTFSLRGVGCAPASSSGTPSRSSSSRSSWAASATSPCPSARAVALTQTSSGLVLELTGDARPRPMHALPGGRGLDVHVAPRSTRRRARGSRTSWRPPYLTGTGSTSRRGPTTPSRSRFRASSSAARTAPDSAPSAGRPEQEPHEPSVCRFAALSVLRDRTLGRGTPELSQDGPPT